MSSLPLRDAESGAYFGRELAWVEALEQAQEYRTLQAAGRKAGQCGREDVVVVVRFDDPVCELALNPAYCMPERGGESQSLQI